MSTGHKLKIGVSGVRGIVGETFSPLLVSAFASAFGEFAGRGVILVGRDTRSSGELFEHAVSAGLSAVGAQVVQTGIVPTPSLLTAVRALNASGAIMITASHNPVEWNALKFIGADGFFLDHHTTEELLDIYNQPDPNYVTEQNLRPVRRLDNIFKMHQEHIFRHIDVDAIRNAGFKVAVDCGNGVGALYSRPFLEAMGVETIALHDSPDKPFERPPEPTPQNIGKLAETVCSHSCDIGFAQDPDGDRIAMVTNTGFIPGIQNSLLPAVEHILSRNPDNVIAANIQTTKALEAIAAKYNSKVVYTPVGEVNVTDAMQKYNAILGIEGGSGGFMVSSFMPCRDSFTAMAVTLELMAQKKVSSDEIYRNVIHYHSADKKIKCSAQAGINALRELAAKYAERNPVLIDGVRIDFGDSWVLVRQSNTEDILRIYAEARTPEKANNLAERFAKEIV